MIDINRFIKNREIRLKFAQFLRFLPTKLYLKILYKMKTGKKLNLKKPIGFNEKLNWLKLNKINPSLNRYVDKLQAREIVLNKIGSNFLTKIYGVFDRFDDIDFSKLPNSFVIKCNHDSGSIKVVRDKSKLSENDFKNLHKFYKGRLKLNQYLLSREYPYKNIVPKIYVEECLLDYGYGEIKDFKFFCSKGKVKFLYVASNRFSDTRYDWYDKDFNLILCKQIHENSDTPILEKPKYFDEMVYLAETLSSDLNFVRIDLILTNKGPLFSEFTFFHGGGLYLFEPFEFEIMFGEFIEL